VRARNRPDSQDDGHQRGTGRHRVLEQLEARVAPTEVCAAMPGPTTAVKTSAAPMSSARARRMCGVAEAASVRTGLGARLSATTTESMVDAWRTARDGG
jgi:hypothetical protein